MTLDHASETLPFGDTRHVHAVANIKDADSDLLALLVLADVAHPNLS
jgi:hypothetical protein